MEAGNSHLSSQGSTLMRLARQSGTVLLVTLVLIVVLSGLALNIYRLSSDSLRRVKVYNDVSALRYFSLAAESYVMAALAGSDVALEALIDTEEVSGAFSAVTANDSEDAYLADVQLEVADLQARFNLTELAGGARGYNGRARDIYDRFCFELGLSPEVAYTLFELVDSYKSDKEGQRFTPDLVYHWIGKVASQVEIDLKDIELLVTNFAVLPKGTRLNIARSPRALMYALAGQDFQARREIDRYFDNNSDARKVGDPSNLILRALAKFGLSFVNDSQFYEITVHANKGNYEQAWRSVVFVDHPGARVQLVLRRRFYALV